MAGNAFQDMRFLAEPYEEVRATRPQPQVDVADALAR